MAMLRETGEVDRSTTGRDERQGRGEQGNEGAFPVRRTMNRTERDRVEPVEMTAQAAAGRGGRESDPKSRAETIKEQNMNKKLKLVSSNGTSRGGERKQRRLAATIAVPEPDRPRLPAQADTASVFDTEAWRKRWGSIRGVGETTGVYIAGCTASMRLGGELGMPVLKPGTAQDVGTRIKQLNSERYGSLRIRDFAVHDEPGWADWEAARLSCRPTHPASPVRVLPRQLIVDLPFWISASDFEALLVAALEPIALASLAASPAGQALSRQRGGDPDMLLRYTRGKSGPILATEIAVIAPSGDTSRLVALIEWVLIRLVVADDGWEG